MQKAHLHLIQWGLNRDYTWEVDIEGEHEYTGTSFKLAKEASEAGDVGDICFLKDGKRVACFSYVHEYQQEPEEVIYDYGINAISEEWSTDYDKHAAAEEALFQSC